MESGSERTRTPGARLTRRDGALAAALFVAALAWFWFQPRNLGAADEAMLLVDARRVANGERLYADIFWLTMPAGQWGLAAVFAAFGSTLGVAKMAMGVVNSATVVLCFAAARRLGVRAALAILPALAFLALVQPAWPYVSTHWVATALIAALLLIVAAPAALERPGRLVGAGLVVGAVAVVQHQMAPVLGLGLAIAVGIACWVRRGAAAPPWWRRLALLAAGAAVVVVPVLLVLVATVDPRRVVEDVILFPLRAYRPFNNPSWGQVGVFNRAEAAYTWPWLLRDLPLLLVIAAAVATVGCVRGWPRRRVAQWSAVLCVVASALGAIAYNPDFIHIAFATPPLLVLAALLIESAVARFAGRHQGLLGAACAAALLAVLALQLTRNAQRMRAEFAVPAETRFGRVDFRSPQEAVLAARIAELLDRSPTRRLFVYPAYAALYLTAGGENPTRVQLLLPSWPQHYAEALAALAAHPTLIVVVGTPGADDPLLTGLDPHYRRAEAGPGWQAYRWQPSS